MLLFIDESGTFTTPKPGKNSISCVAGLMFPHRRYRHLIDGFRKLKINWGSDPAAEIKGSRLNEAQISSVIDLLLANRATCCAAIYDGTLTSSDTITAHKILQAQRYSKPRSPQHTIEMRRWLLGRRRQVRSMSNQLYIQAKALVSLCEDSLQTMLIEYPQSHPSELGNIEIYADAKDIKVTPFEEYWKIAILPELQSRSSRKPLGMIAGADYSHFDKMYRGEAAAVPSHLADLFPSRGGPYEYTDIGWIFRNIHIEQSHEHIGLQLVDIVANCLTRILKENIQPAGWRKFPRLFLSKTAGALTLITFLPTKGPPPPYQKQAIYIHQNARTAAVHRFPKPSNRSIAMHGRKNT